MCHQIEKRLGEIGELVHTKPIEGILLAADALSLIRKSYQAGRIEPTAALENYERLLDALSHVSNSFVLEELGQCYFTIAGCLSDLIPVSRSLMLRAIASADDCGWNQRKQETVAIFLRYADSDFDEASSALLQRSKEDPYARLLLARMAPSGTETEDIENIIAGIPSDDSSFVKGQITVAELKRVNWDYYGAETYLEGALGAEPWNDCICDDLLRTRVAIAVGEALKWDLDYYGLDEAIEDLLRNVRKETPK